MKREPLKAGERCAVYRSGVRGTGKVTHGSPGPGNASGGIWVELDKKMLAEDHSHAVFVSPKQCRRLRKKKPVERVEKIWAKVNVQMLDKQTHQQLDNRQFNFFFYDSGQFLNELILPLEGNGPLVSLRLGEILVSKEALARAWDEEVVPGSGRAFNKSADSETFKDLCKALGLKEST